MRFARLLYSLTLALLATLGQPSNVADQTLTRAVKTTSGVVKGQAAWQKADVSTYLGIPFAKPPVGHLRFAAPQPFPDSGVIQASAFSPDCPSNVATSSFAHSQMPLAGPHAVKILDSIQQFQARLNEDCLTLNIWTKLDKGEKAKAVLFWLYGGGFSKGTSSSFLYDGQFLADSEDVVVVSANYRVAAFGFPGLPGMDQNLGLLDQRLAIEWVRDNIAGFGGDPSRITIFGQSAGGSSADYYSYAWRSDPIVNGFISESGVATSFAQPTPADNTAAWYTLSQKLGCGDTSAGRDTTVSCMRTKAWAEIQQAMASSGTFGPTVDNKLVFADYSRRTALGEFIRRPMLLGNNDYEAGIIKVIFAQAGKQLTPTQWAMLNLQTFTCPVGRTAQGRAALGVPTWRYRYFGEFPNLRLTEKPNSGAWHGSEIATVFGTAEQAGKRNTRDEEALSRYMMGAWAAFAKNPTSALSDAPYAWPRYDTNKNTLIRLGFNNETSASYILPVVYDYACSDALAISGPHMAGLDSVGNLTELGGGSPSDS